MGTRRSCSLCHPLAPDLLVLFEWALSRIDDVELRRLGRILHSSLEAFAPFWRLSGAIRAASSVLPAEEVRSLGWPGPDGFTPVAREVVVRDILDPLATIGIAISDEERARWLAP